MAEPLGDQMWVWVHLAPFQSQSESVMDFTELQMEAFPNQAHCKASTPSAS